MSNNTYCDICDICTRRATCEIALNVSHNPPVCSCRFFRMSHLADVTDVKVRVIADKEAEE